MIPKWKRAGPDGEIEIKFPTGRRFKIEKQYDSNIRHKGEWKVMEWDARSRDWEWGDTYSFKAYAKQKAMDAGQYDTRGKKVADYSKTFQYESVSMQEEKKGLWANIWAKRRAGKKMRKKGEKGAPTPDAIRSAQGRESVGEDAPTMNTGAIPDPKSTAQGPMFKPKNVTDRRRKKEMILLKRFRKHMEDEYR